MSPTSRTTFRIAAVMAALSVSVAACSSSGGGSGGNPDTAPGGSTAVQKLTSDPKLANKTIGFLLTSSTAEIQELWAHDVATADGLFGWKTVIKDGQGSPQGFQQGMQQLIAEKVSAIIMSGIEPQTIATQLKSAKAAGIPVFVTTVPVSSVDSDLVSANYVDNEVEMGRAIANYALKTKAAAKVVIQNVSPVYNVNVLTKAQQQTIEAGGGKVLAVADNDLANLATSYGKTATSLLTAHPDADFIFPSTDFGPAADLPAMQQIKAKAQIVTLYDNGTSLKYIRAGANVAVLAVNTERTNLQALDSLAAYWADGTAIPRTVTGDAQEEEIVTKANVVPSGPTYPFATVLKPFETKWAAGKFGTSS